MRAITLIAVLLFAVSFIGTALAVPGGKTVEYAGGDAGKVVFNGQTHADAGGKCPDCHPKLFPMKTGSVKITAPHPAGEFCGACHDGTKAFNQEGNCEKCHTK